MFGLKKLFGTSTKASPSGRGRPPGGSTVRLEIDRMEDRMVLSTVATAPNGTVYAIFNSDRELWWQDKQGNWSQGAIMNNVSQVSVGANGFVDVLKTDNTLRQWNSYNGMWSTIPHGPASIGTIAAGQNGEVYITYGSNHDLWEYNGGWNPLYDSNVADIGVGAFGQLYKVYYNGGALGSADAIDSPQSRNTILGSGVDHVAGGYQNWDFWITYGSNNQLWHNDGHGGWTPGEANVAQISAGMDGTYAFVTTGGELVPSGWSQQPWGGAWTY
jgi:hypothetical protein